MALDSFPPADLEARLRAMPEPRVDAGERGAIERALAGGFAYCPGLSLDAHRVLSRRVSERALRRSRMRAEGRP